MFFPFIPAQIIFIHMHHEMHRSGIYRVIKKTLDSLRKHLIHKREQLHKVVNRKKSVIPSIQLTRHRAVLCMRINCCTDEEIGNKVIVKKILPQNAVQALSSEKMQKI